MGQIIYKELENHLITLSTRLKNGSEYIHSLIEKAYQYYKARRGIVLTF